MNPGRDAGEGDRTTGGAFLLLVGPDGSGKSTLARRLTETSGRFPETLHIHWRPRVLPHLGRMVGVDVGDPSDPHAREPRGPLLSLALLAYNWADFFLGSWLRILPVRKRGGLVVMERGWPDIGVDPRRYRLSVSPRLVRLMGRLLPAPDVVLVLRADPAVLRGRKAELPLAELDRQLRCWERMPFSRKTKRSFLDASQDEQGLVTQAERALSAT